jgi:hypothetical protein
MKKFLTALLLCFPSVAAAQPSLQLASTVISTNTRGSAIVKEDTILVTVKLTTPGALRGVYFDFQHQFTAISLLSVTIPYAGAAGSAIPAGATTTIQNYFYPNCSLNKNSQNTTTNSWTNYQNANYTCNSNTVPNHAINRIYVNMASSANLVAGDYMYLKFKVTNVAAGFAYDSIYMNFAAGYDASGNAINPTTLGNPRSTFVQLSAGANNLITGQVKLGPNVTVGMRPEVMIMTNAATPVFVTKKMPDASGNFTFGSELTANTSYQLYLMILADSVGKWSQSAVTVSDYTTAYQEFLTQNLDGTFKNTNINKGIKYLNADVNANAKFDGGDPQLLFTAITGLDTISKYTPSSGCDASCRTSIAVMPAVTYDTLGVTSWKTYTPLQYLPFTTTTSDQALVVKYLVPGDVNLSHGSPLTTTTASMASMASLLVDGAPTIDVNVANVIVTSNTITVPFEVDTKNVALTGLQFEVYYDPTKVKFEKMDVNTPSWVTFVNPTTGTIRFGAIDKNLKNPITGRLTPFKLQFSALQSGLDLNTTVKLSSVYDAADGKGQQVNINLNTTVIKIIGANNFLKP